MAALAALIKIDTKEILKVYDKVPVPFVNVSNLWQSYTVPIGWISPDNAYRIVKVISFNVPDGFQVIGEANYTINDDLTVNEIFNTEALPKTEVAVSYLDLLNLMTKDEIANLQKVVASDPEMFMFEKEALLHQNFRLDDPFVLLIKDKLVSKNIITDARAQEIFKNVIISK